LNDDDEHATAIAMAKRGSASAFTAIWQHFSGQVYGYVSSFGIRDADDVTSEVFLGLFQSIEHFDGDSRDFRSWLFSIAHHRCVDELRRSRRTPDLTSYEPERDRREAPSAETESLRRIEVQAGLDLVRCLPRDQRDVLMLRLVAELTVAETGHILGRSPAAVRQLQHRAIAAVRALAAPRPTEAGRV
jgi:RNA polymerase sigma-70 factor (ECF subfamily)